MDSKCKKVTSVVLSSELEADPDMVPIILQFVDLLPQRLKAIKRSWEEKDWKNLKKAAHELKSAGLFGYLEFGEMAGRLEYAAVNQQAEDATALIRELVNYSDRIIAGREQIAYKATTETS